MKDFFTTLEVPELNSNYAQNLKDFVQAVNNNFAKVASLPFLKGDSGVSIEVYAERMYNEVDGERVYTDFGKAVISCIYGTEEFPTEEMAVCGVHSYEDLQNIEAIEVFYDRSQGLKYLTVPFMFHDARKNYLGEILEDELCGNFIDMSTFVVGGYELDGETGEKRWVLTQHNFEPKLYYNKTIKKFCWSIGSQKTDIIAQGVEGKAGASVYAKYCKGELDSNRTYINITEVLNDGSLDFVENDGVSSMVTDGDFVMVEFTHEDGSIDLTFGKVITVGGQQCIPYFEAVTVSSLASNVTLKELLDRVGETVENNDDNVRGLYVYSKNRQTATENNVARKPHMFWVDNKETAHLGMFGSETATTENTPTVENDGVLDIDYGKVNTNTLDADLYTHTGKDAKIFSYGDGDTNKFELQQSGVDAGVSDDSPICFVPNPSVVYKEPSAMFATAVETEVTKTEDETKDGAQIRGNNKIPSVEQYDFENTLSINTYIPTTTTVEGDEEKPTKNVVIGGTFEFALPNLAVQNGEKLYNTKQFVNANTKNADPISVTLQKVELNNNKEKTDNTSYGWRYYLDNLLYASPIDEHIYAGTTNSVLSIDYNNKKYKANVIISVLQYRVGYNSNEELAFKQGTWLRSKTIGGNPYTPEILEESHIDWYKRLDPQPIDDTTKNKSYVRFNAVETYTEGNYTNDNVVTLFEKYSSENPPETPNGFTKETQDDGTTIYYDKLSWTERTFKYKTTVTDVIYYIVPMEEIKGGETDLFSVINNKGTTENVADTLACMKYRIFFKSNKKDNENINTVYYNHLEEPVKGNTLYSAVLCVEIDNKTENNIFKLYKDNSASRSNVCFVFPQDEAIVPLIELDTKTKTTNVRPLRNDKTYLHPTKNNVEATLGKYNNFVWCSGRIVFKPTPIQGNYGILLYYLVNRERCAPSCGRMLPQLPNQINNTKWVLPLTDMCKVDSSKQYEFYTEKGNDTKVNTLSTNLRDADFQQIVVGDVSLQYILEKDNGWYINDRRIVTEAVNTEGKTYGKYNDVNSIPTNTTNNGGTSTDEDTPTGSEGDSQFKPNN